MLRCGNLIPYTRAEADPMRHLSWGRVERHPDGIILNIILSKTIQNCERVHEIPLSPCRDPMFCPVRAIDTLMELRGVSNCLDSELVFCVPTTGGWAPLTKPLAGRLFGSQLAAMGLDSSAYSFHSFRFGGLQEALLADNPIDLIRIHSDHRSTAIFGYLNLPGSRRFGVASRVCDRLSLLRGVIV